MKRDEVMGPLGEEDEWEEGTKFQGGVYDLMKRDRGLGP